MRLPVRLRKRNPAAHKYDCGHVLVLGGSAGMVGSVCLAARAALRSGCGLVSVGVPETIADMCSVKLTEPVVVPLYASKKTFGPRVFEQVRAYCSRRKVDVVACGCGMRLTQYTKQLARQVIAMDMPVIIDADGLNALAPFVRKPPVSEKMRLILTPHAGEFGRLCPEFDARADRKVIKSLVKDFALRYNLVLILKGHRTIVTDGQRIFENSTGNPGMATAGSGDVLTGIIAGLVAQQISCFDAAMLGVYLHGAAGDAAVCDTTQMGLVASDIIEYLPQALRQAVRV